MDVGHVSVLQEEFLGFFENLNIEVFLDGTLGAGGHSLALLKNHPEIQTLIGFDQDASAIKIAQERLKPYESQVNIVTANFCEMHSELEKRQLKADGILLDIGVSSMQLDQAERGFSFSKKGPLDMRMDQSCELTAAEVVNTWSEKELGELFRDYGDVAKWRLAAQKIVEERKKKPLKTTQDLVDLLSPFLRKTTKKSIHPLTLVFQALRIAVNNELKVLEYTLPKIVSYLKPGGRLCVISFHSGEDRIVKNVFKDLCQKGSPYTLLTKKPIVPSETEIQSNIRSRSAKMRVLEKVKEGL